MCGRKQKQEFFTKYFCTICNNRAYYRSFIIFIAIPCIINPLDVDILCEIILNSFFQGKIDIFILSA